jgi:aminoglycoside phosphotransferase family enzyme/gluconate kinase
MHDRLIESLKDASVYPHPVDRIELVETHISWVLMAGEFVYKIKKPLDLGFLDFTALADRRFYCKEEIRLNRRTAPELYLGVVAITGSRDRPALDGGGDALEYAVRMRRFDSRMGFDRLLARGELTADQVADLAGALADLHAVADVAAPGGERGSFEEIAGPMRDNFDALDDAVDGESRRTLQRLSAWTGKRLAELEDSIRQRQRDGFVRECHGDAHLGNVTLYRDRATLFDCIEFSAELRWIDVINDLAFTVMDLRDRGAPALSWVLLDEYLARTGDFDGIRLLPLYAVYRALVRAKVQSFARDQADDRDARERLDEEVRGYIALAAELAAEHRPAVVVTTGLSGSGKSWLAERLVPRAGLIRVRSDVERKRLHGLAPDARSDSALNTDLYSAEATERTYARLVDAAAAICDAGMPALLDAAFLKRWQRDRLRDFADARGVAFRILHCRAPQDTLAERIRARERRGDDASEADVKVLQHQLDAAEPPAGDEHPFTDEVDTRADDAVERAVEALGGIVPIDASATRVDSTQTADHAVD